MYVCRALFLSLNLCHSLSKRKALLIRIMKTLLILSDETFLDIDDELSFN